MDRVKRSIFRSVSGNRYFLDAINRRLYGYKISHPMKSLSLALTLLCAAPILAAPATDSIAAKNGPIQITALFHASTLLQYGPLTIYVDPIGAASYTRKADAVLITHSHPDHLDLATIRKVLKPGGVLIGSRGTEQQLGQVAGADLRILSYYEDTNFAYNGTLRGMNPGTVKVRAVPAYNIVRGPKPGQKFHPKYIFDGYVLNIGGKTIYFAGDTENTPEMRDLKGVDAAFVPMNLPYTMTPDEAARAVKAFRPKVVYPYHFRYPFDKPSGNAEKFAADMKGSGVKVKILDWYPANAVKKMMAASKG